MTLNEILDTKIPITWSKTSDDNADYFRGEFNLDEKKYEIHIDVRTAKIEGKFITFADFGFTANDSFALTNAGKSGKIFGAVFNGAIPKLKSLNADMIMFGVNFKNEAVESRKSLYEKFASWYSRGSIYQYSTGWFNTKNGSYKLLSKKPLSSEALEEIKNSAALVPSK